MSSEKLEQALTVDMDLIRRTKFSNKNGIDVDTEAVKSVDIIADNKLDKEFESILKPLNFMAHIFFCTKYKIRNRKMTPNGAVFKVIAGFCTFLLMLVCGYYIIGFPITFQVRGYDSFIQWSKVVIFSLLFIGTFLNYFTSIFCSERNVLFVLKIQGVCNVLKMSDDVKRLRFSNWFHVVILQMCHVCWILYSYFFFPSMGAGYNITSYYWAAIDTNMMYALRTIKLLTMPLQNWVKTMKLMRLDEEESWNSMLKVYKDILESYGIFEETFQHMIVFYAIQTTMRSLLAVVIRIELWKVSSGRTTAEYFFFSIISITWVFKNIMLFVLLSVESERLYSAMEEVQSTCKELINRNQCSENQKRVCKNIQRLHKTNFKKMCVCSVFFIDAAMSFQLSSIISTYTIVILQFEFL